MRRNYGIALMVLAASCMASAASLAQTGIPDSLAGKFTVLIDAQATPEAKGLMRYLSSIYGNHVLAGEQMSYDGPWNAGKSVTGCPSGNCWADELGRISNLTGKQPALRGYDFMDVINSWGSSVMTYALAWARDSGGIVEVNWHWRLGGGSFYSPADGGSTTFPNDYTTVDKDLEQLAAAMKPFADAKIPLLWRPLHEAPGNWFWWSYGNSSQYIALWKHEYDVLVNQHGLHNLIWVYSAADNNAQADWYPGNQYVDIIGDDAYNSSAWQNDWNALWSICNKGARMQAMTENQDMPTWSTNTPWLWFLTWNNEIIQKVSDQTIKNAYSQPQTIAMTDLPTYMAKANWEQMLPHSSSSSAPVSSSSKAITAIATREHSAPGAYSQKLWDLLGRRAKLKP